MAPQRIFLYLSVLLTVMIAVNCEEKQRNITITYNDGCTDPECMGANGTFYNVVHFRALGAADTIHYVWSSIGAPSLLMVRTSKEAKMNVDWNKAMSMEEGAITFKPATGVYSVSAYVISRLLEYNDTKDTADITQANPNMTMSVDVANLTWSNVTINSTDNTVLFETMNNTDPAPNGTFSLKVRTVGVEGRSPDLPHLQHMPNTTEFSLLLDNLEQHYTNSRFALELLIVRDQSKSKNSGITVDNKQSIDDEYTPSVFKTYELLLNRTDDAQQGSFMQWKPIVYTSSDRTTGDSKPAVVYSLNSTNHFISNYSIAQAYFGNLLEKDIASLNISFGITKDGFYNESRYYLWSCTTGYGTPPSEGLSILIISIISAGLGIPVIVLVFGGVYVACQKRIALKKQNELKYTAIN